MIEHDAEHEDLSPAEHEAFTRASEAAWYHARLQNPELLCLARDFRGWLAVPVGGARKSGSIVVAERLHGARVVEELKRQPDLFPNPRLHRYDPPHDAFIEVVWGEPQPEPPSLDAPDAAWEKFWTVVGRSYGYREELVAAFARRLEGATA